MATDDSIRAAAQAFESMTDDEATAWIAAGDYTSVAGVPLPEAATSKFARLAAGDEVEGFSFGLNAFSPQPIQLPEADAASKGSPSLFKSCCTGKHLKEAVLHL